MVAPHRSPLAHYGSRPDAKKDSSDFFQRFDHHLPPLFLIQDGKIDAQEEFLRANMDALHWLGNPEPTKEKKHSKQKTESGNALEEWWSNQLVFSNKICCGELRLFLLQLWTYLGESQLQPVPKGHIRPKQKKATADEILWCDVYFGIFLFVKGNSIGDLVTQ